MAAYLNRASNASLPVRPEAGTRGRLTSGRAACSRSRRTCSAGTATILAPAAPASAIAGFAASGFVPGFDLDVLRRTELIEVLNPFEGILVITTLCGMVGSGGAIAGCFKCETECVTGLGTCGVISTRLVPLLR